MNKLPKYRQFMVAAIGILSLIMSWGNSRHALAAQSASDLSVSVVADKSKVKIGEYITYTVVATNLGPDAALLVGVSHGLSDQLNFVSLTCDRGISSDGTFCEYAALNPGETVVSTLVATPNPSDRNSDRNILFMTAGIAFETTDAIDSNRGNNLMSVSVRLVGRLAHP